MLVVPRDVSGATGAGAVLVEGLVHLAQDIGVAAHAQVVIGAPDGDPLLLAGHVGAGELLGQAVDVVEVAVGLVLVLLLELGIVVGLVVELCVGVDGVDGRSGGMTGNSVRDMGYTKAPVSARESKNQQRVLGDKLTFLTAGDDGGLDGAGLVGAASVQAALGHPGAVGVLGGDGAGGQAGDASGSADAADLCGLDGEGLAHDGAAVGQALQTGHGASAWGRGSLGGRASRGGQRAQGRGGSLLHEGAHGLGLPENSVHVGRRQLGLLVGVQTGGGGSGGEVGKVFVELRFSVRVRRAGKDRQGEGSVGDGWGEANTWAIVVGAQKFGSGVWF